ncbi:MAG: FHA domain-containing protein [Chloroflexota bacterium]|nr:FHA domain-containing protein [Chloroflexota bacterium]
MPVTNEALPIIVGQGGKYDTHRWVIEDELIIGRTEACSVFIADRQVSRFHAQLTRNGDKVTIEDLNSKNGTFHNGKAIDEPVQLTDGDIIQIALAQEFLYLSTDATIPLDHSEFQRASSRTHPRALQLAPDSHRVWVNEQEIDPPLSALQFKLLAILHEDAGRVFSRNELIIQVWGETEAFGVTDQALDALVRRLRNRLSEAETEHEYIVTIRGQGFRLDNP